MSDKDRYPDPPIDANEGGQLVRILRNWDEPHLAKAAILAKMARTEFLFAIDAQEHDAEGLTPDDFEMFVENTDAMIDEAMENLEE